MYLATVLDCCTKKAVGYAMADNMRTDLICEAIDMAARRCPYTTGETIFHSDRGCRYTSEQLARHLESYGTRPSVARTGVCWAGAWAEVGGRPPQGTRGPIRWCIPQEARPSAILPPRSSPVHTIRDSSTPPWGTGRRAKSTRSTEQQDKQLETPFSELSETRPAVHTSCPSYTAWRPTSSQAAGGDVREEDVRLTGPGGWASLGRPGSGARLASMGAGALRSPSIARSLTAQATCSGLARIRGSSWLRRHGGTVAARGCMMS